MKKLFTLLFAISFLSHAFAQITLDGNIIEPQWGAPLVTSAGGPTPSFGAGQEINAIYATAANTSNIYIAVAGNVQNGNRILVFLDTKTGGYNNGNFGRAGAPPGVNNFNSGSTFDAGFSPDYCLVIGTNAAMDNYYFDLYTLSGILFTGGGPNNYLGDKAVMGASPANGMNTRGFEIVIPKASLGYVNGTSIKMMAMYTGESGFLSNQFLTPAGAGDGNYGGGAVDFSAATPNPVTVPASVLPVNITSFSASKNAMVTNIFWETASENMNAGYQVERSADGKNFSVIGEVTGLGNGTAAKSYNFTDASPLSGINYYRLKAIDINGAATYSKVVAVKFSSKEEGITGVFPNPAKDILRVEMKATAPVNTLVQITDLKERTVLSQKAFIVKGANVLTINVATLAAGTYLVKINDDVTKFIKQ